MGFSHPPGLGGCAGSPSADCAAATPEASQAACCQIPQAAPAENSGSVAGVGKKQAFSEFQPGAAPRLEDRFTTGDQPPDTKSKSQSNFCAACQTVSSRSANCTADRSFLPKVCKGAYPLSWRNPSGKDGVLVARASTRVTSAPALERSRAARYALSLLVAITIRCPGKIP